VEGAERQIESMKSGKPAKLPRQVLDRFEEFQKTTSLTFQGIQKLCELVERMVIPKANVFSMKVIAQNGSLSGYPIPEQEIAAIQGSYLQLAQTWIPQTLTTSSRAKVDARDLAIAFAIIRTCTLKMNADGSMPTARVKAIWDRMYLNGEVDWAFDYHRWKEIRDLMEVRGGLVMDDRHYYTGFTNAQGQEIKGKAARWHMAEWLVEKLEEMAEYGYQDEKMQISLAEQSWGGPLLERSDQEQEKTPSEAPWIVQFRQLFRPTIGLIWAGTMEDVPKLAA
jgi:hypothetical protein